MPDYVIYDTATGEILHVHRELLMDADRPLELNDEEVLAEVGDLLPAGATAGVLAVAEPLQAKRDILYYVDPTTRTLALRRRPASGREQRA